MRTTKSETKDKVDNILKDIEEGAKKIYTSDMYRKYILAMSKFRRYSVNNAIIIFMHKGSLVAGYKKWETAFHRHVKKGEKGIKILGGRPVQYEIERAVKTPDGQIKRDGEGKPITQKEQYSTMHYFPVTVFDVSQTEGEPLPEYVKPLTGSVKEYARIKRALEEISPYRIYFVNKEEMATPGANGVCICGQKEIQILDELSEVQTIKTMIHEIAHAQLHSPEAVAEAGAEASDKSAREIEAESIACIVADHLGLDTSSYSFAYVASWAEGKEAQILLESAKRIKGTALDFISKVDTLLPEYAVPDLEELGSSDKVAPEAESDDRCLAQRISDAVSAAKKAEPRKSSRSADEHER